jgi:hypothetical protein
MSFWFYAWRILVGIFYVALTAFVFDHLEGDRALTITVAILGLIYGLVWLNNALGLLRFNKTTNKQLLQIRELLGYPPPKLELDPRAQMAKCYISLFFIAAIGLICMLALFGILVDPPPPRF